MQTQDVIAEVTFRLTPLASEGERRALTDFMDQCLEDRKQKGQFLHANCGCVFKNNHHIGVSSGFLLEHAGAQSIPIHAGAQVSAYHANFIFNKGASSQAIIELSHLMRCAAFDTYGVWLDYEMELLGEFPKELTQLITEKRAQDHSPHKRKNLEEARKIFSQKLQKKMSMKPL